jgi:hypothetical protein
MNFLNTETSVLHAPEYIGAGPVERATWFNLSLWCAQQENGGRIVGAAGWKDRQWQQTCGVMLKEVQQSPGLLRWDGNDLLVWNYPKAQEDEVIAKRKAGRRTAEMRWGATRSADDSATRSAGHSVNSSATSSVHTEGKGIGIGKEVPPKSPKGDRKVLGKFLAEIEPVTLRKRLVDVSVLIGRRVTTIWTAKELEAVRTLRVKDMAGEEWEADVWALWRYYREQKDGAENDYRRRDVVTLLNNWPGDVAKCRQRMAAQDTAMGQKEEREHWARAEWDDLAAKADARLQIELEGGAPEKLVGKTA